MSGHSKWSSIKHKKAAIDAKRGKVFSKLSKELMLAAKIGGKDSDTNIRLRSAIAAAKSANMPQENIQRAIKKGCGELEGAMLEELSYEGYAPGGVAIIVDCLSDNRNRTAADIRHLFSKGNGTLASNGAVSWFFQRKTRLVLGGHLDETVIMERCFERDIEIDDIYLEGEHIEIIAPPSAFDALIQMVEKTNMPLLESELVRIPENEVLITDVSIARQVIRLLHTIEEYEDVQNVYSNFMIDDAIIEQLD